MPPRVEREADVSDILDGPDGVMVARRIAEAAIDWGVAWHTVMDETLRDEDRQAALPVEKAAYERLKELTAYAYRLHKGENGGSDG